MTELFVAIFATICYLAGYYHGNRKHVIAKGQVIKNRYWGNDE